MRVTSDQCGGERALTKCMQHQHEWLKAWVSHLGIASTTPRPLRNQTSLQGLHIVEYRPFSAAGYAAGSGKTAAFCSRWGCVGATFAGWAWGGT
jgi:hypothetical protein